MTERLLAGAAESREAPLVEAADAELLEHFVARRDEAAFAVLMARHGPMVFGVCRRLLHRAQDAEDAFQATFLILVRKAASIGRRELLAPWLYRVAFRVAARARLLAAKRHAREATDMERVSQAQHVATEATELSVAILEEVQRLPARYRLPVVLYYFKRLTSEQVAGELRCQVNTIKTRLSRARAMLRKRLIRRGLAMTSTALATVLLAETAAASLPSALLDATLKAAVCFAAGDAAAGGAVSAQPLTLTKGVLHTMFVTKMKTVAVLGLALVLVLGGVGVFAYQRLAAAAAAGNKDSKNIQGAWKLVSIKVNGKDLKGDEAKKIKSSTFEFTPDRIIVKYGDETRESTYKIDPTAMPRTIDTEFSIDNRVVEKTHGIYKLEGDALTICGYSNARNEDRPTTFESKEGNGAILMVLKRVKK